MTEIVETREVGRNVGRGLDERVEPREDEWLSRGLGRLVGDVDLPRMEVGLFSYVEMTGYPGYRFLGKGQAQGGIAQAVGAALFEELVYDPESGQLVNGTMLDYFMPTAADLPELVLDHTEVPSPVTPFGVRGVGESGTIPPAAANAICDALSPFGIVITRLPITPEYVWQLIREAKAREEAP